MWGGKHVKVKKRHHQDILRFRADVGKPILQSIGTPIGLGRFSTWGGSNNCERSEETKRLREAFTGVQGAGIAPLHQALFGLNLQKYMIWGLQGGS